MTAPWDALEGPPTSAVLWGEASGSRECGLQSGSSAQIGRGDGETSRAEDMAGQPPQPGTHGRDSSSMPRQGVP